MGEYLGMSFNSLKVKFFIAFALVLATVLPSLAEENVISQVVISKSKDRANSYELTIDSSEIVQYKSRIDEDGNVYFDLKNSTLAPDMGTIYDDVINIDNVTVKQLDKNRVRIYVSGKDARNTDLVFVNSLFETSVPSKKVTINRPIKEYKSTILNNDLEYQDNTQEWDDNSFNFSYLSATMMTELKEGPIGKILIVLSLFAFLLILARNLAAKLSQDKEPLIGLNQNINHQMGSLGISVKKQQLQQPMLKAQKRNDDLVGISKRNEALKQAQIELTRAHEKYQQYIQNKYQGIKQPKTVDVDALRKSIALNQYQKSTQNPYKNQEVIKIDEIRNTSNETFKIPPRPRMQEKQAFSSPYIQRKTNLVNSNYIKEQPKQNMRFLESVTKIYERSGRADLADGLKNSITKAKQTI